MLLYASLARAEVDVATHLLLLDVRHTREHIAVTLSISAIDVTNPLVNKVERGQCLIPLPEHPIFCSGVKMRMRLDVPKLVRQNAYRNFA